MLQGLVDADAFGRVQHQGAVQQVLELHHLLPLVLRQPLASDHVRQEVFGWVDGAHHRHLLLNSRKEGRRQIKGRKTVESKESNRPQGSTALREERAPYPFCHFVDFNVQEVQILIEVLVFEQAFTDHLEQERQNIASAITC